MSNSPRYTPAPSPEVLACTCTVTGCPVFTVELNDVAEKIPGVAELVLVANITGVGDGLLMVALFNPGLVPFAALTKIRPVVDTESPGLFCNVLTLSTIVMDCGEFAALVAETLIWP